MPPGKRFVCIHGHFYQPPRENPWLETVEIEDSAAPYHDWNERICAECYAPNGAARVVNQKNHIMRIVNNYARMSFNFGPTLISWLKENAPRTYSMILEGERRSHRRYRGHSSAMAQAYNHMILPLASTRDRITQIRWGMADYESSFGAKPELVEGLTTDHEALSVDLWALSPYGGTALNDGVYEAALYLGRAAPVSRRAVILVSDNEPSDEETRTVPEVVRAAQQSGTPVYSVKVGNLEHSKTFFLLHSEPRMHDVEKICKQTGGELIDTRTGTTVSAAMQTILTWLKQGYTLGYSPSNKRRDGSYRTIEVRLNGPGAAREHKYRTYARPGYYAPAGP